MILFLVGTIISLILLYFIIKTINQKTNKFKEGNTDRGEIMDYVNARTTATLDEIDELEEARKLQGSTNSKLSSLGFENKYSEGFTVDCLDADEFVMGEYKNINKNSVHKNPIKLTKNTVPQPECKRSDFAKWLEKCKRSKSCTDLDELNRNAPDGWECVHCADTNTFFSRNKKTGVKTNICSDEKWISSSAIKCEEKKAFKECGEIMTEGEKKLQRCGKIPNKLKDKCGYCPTNNKILPMTVTGQGDSAKYTPTYLEEGSGGECSIYDLKSGKYTQKLIPTDKCELFMKNNPCLTSKFDSGPQSPECLQQLWNTTDCPDWIDKKKGWKKASREIQSNKSRKELGVIPMKKWFKQITRDKMASSKYKISKDGYNTCYNWSNTMFKKGDKIFKDREGFQNDNEIIHNEDTGFMHPCSYKTEGGQYEPNEDCAKIIFQEAGCEIKNDNKNIGNNINNQEYQKIWKRNNKWTSKTNVEFDEYDNGKSVEDRGKWATWLKENIIDVMRQGKTYEDRKKAAEKCGVPPPPEPKPIKPGDEVEITGKQYKLIGTVMEIYNRRNIKTKSTGINPPLPLKRCEGDCDRDSDCMGALKCKQRNRYEGIPGCNSSGTKRAWDYCYDPEKVRFKVMWTNIKNGTRVYDRYSLKKNNAADQKIEEDLFGWPDVLPKNVDIVKTFEMTEDGVPERFFDVYKRRKECKGTGVCADQQAILSRMRNQFPAPRKCVYSDWKTENNQRCPTRCIPPNKTNNKINNRPINKIKWTRRILVNGTYSEKCKGPLERIETCKNVRFCQGETQTKKRLKEIGGNPRRVLDECEGDCDYDNNRHGGCRGPLKCFHRQAPRRGSWRQKRRLGFKPVPGCSGRGRYNRDYCYDPKKQLKWGNN